MDVQPGLAPQADEAVISVRMSAAAAARFGRFTGDNIGRTMAMVSAAQISANFTPETARTLAILLRGGALPAKLIILSVDVFSEPGRGK